MSKEEPVCFVIMPISDQDGYETGHFGRVYEYLIKPACIHAGFVPVRADEQSKTNYIVIDIIKQILKSDMVICDLSAKNPNVLYELGIRQAFNKKAFLIKDIKTERIFDIQGLRTTTYNEDLRIDSVQTNVIEVSKGLKETFEADVAEVNSLVQLLSIKPAQLNDTVKLTDDSSVILKAIDSLSDRLGYIENSIRPSKRKYLSNDTDTNVYSINGTVVASGSALYIGGTKIGTLLNVFPDETITYTDLEGKGILVTNKSPNHKLISHLPY